MKSILITGASTGIGYATARHFDQLGWRVFAGVRKEADAQRLREASSTRLTPLMLDVTHSEQVATALAKVREAVGDHGLDALVNNAGIAVGGPVEYVPLERWRRQFEVNVFGVVAVTQAALPLLRQARGRIVNISSVSGLIAAPFFGPYAASKFALEALSDSLRLEVAPQGIRVILIEPGAVATPIWEKGRQEAQTLREHLPPEGMQWYGRLVARMERWIAASERNAMPVEHVVRVIEEAVAAPRPKSRYVVARGASRFAPLMRCLPTTLRDRLFKRLG